MNELSQYLVNQILLEDTELHNFVVVYSGRFQPFHKGHYATYQNLCKKFGKDKVFIGTSNKTDSRQSPFNFKEKKIIMTKMFGIPSNKIVEIKNPYAPTEILKNFDETTTGYISVVGEKDEMRLGGKYFEKYKGKIEQGYKEKGYVYVSPSQSNPISGTNVRNWLSKGDDEQQKAGFLKAYPKFDEKIFKLITLKLKTMSEGMPGGTGIGISLPNGTINGAPKPEDVKKMRKKLDDEDDINEVLNEVKWEGDTFARCMQGQLPLSLNIVKQLVDPIKTTSLHVTTIENLPKVAALEGTKKSISTFNKIDKYSKIIQNGKGVDTDGGIFVLLSGVVLAQSIMDLWTSPDKQGRRWVNPGTIIDGLGREQDVVFNFAPHLQPFKKRWKEDPLNEFTPAEKNEFIRNYYDAAQKFMLSKKKEFQDKYLNSNKLYYESDWNEVVLTQIKIEKILAIPSNWSEDEVENQKTLEKLKQKYPKVEVGENTNDIQNFIKKNGGSIRESVSEDITLDVKIGDTILMGKFKNKKTVVKTIGKDEHGMPTINGKKVATFRILPKVNIFKEAATVSGGDDSQPDGGYLPKGKARVLGGDDGVNSSDDWFVRGGYTQTDFPKADAIYAADDENQITFKIKTKNNARSLNKPTTYPLGFDDIDVTQEIEKIEKAEKRLKKKSKQKDSISELISDYSDLLDSLFESDGEDDKYVHVGYGKYKEKSKKDVEGAPLFKKDDSGKYTPIGGDEKGGEAKPTGQAIQGADMFKHDKSVKQPKEEPKKEPTEDWRSGKDGWEILDDDRAKVTTVRDYSDEEYKGETGEYFENEVTKKVAPNAFKDESEMIQKMKDAEPVYISSEELQNMSNTDVGDILSASEEGGKDSMKARGKELADEYGKDWDRLEKGIEGGNDVPPPIVLRDKNGKLHLLAGNTRLMSFTAYGKKLPVKVIDYDGEFNYDEEEAPQPDEPKRSISKNIQRKISGWAEKEKEFFTKGQDKPKSETRRSIGETLRDKAKGARNAIVHGFKHEAHLFKSAAKGVGNFVSGKEVTKEERKALLDVGKKVVIAGILGVATGGLSHGILPFAQHLAVEFVPHIVAETLLMGASKAALFADTNEDERALLAFVDKIIDGIENMEVPEDVMNTAIDTYNQKKDSDKDNLEEIAVQVDDIPNEPLTEVKKESVVNYYKEICKDLKIKPIAVKFGSVGHAGAATTYDTKTFVPEYITFDLSKVTDIERAILHEITHQILLVKQQNPFHNCNKNIGFKKLENKLIDRYFYSSQSAVLREKVKVEMAKTDMDSVEKYADSQMSPTDVDLGRETDHFFQRLNDPRNGKEISPAELTGLFKRLARNKKKFLEFLKQYKEFVVKDRVSNINIAFIKVADRLIAKTVMRKADFKSSTPVFTTESLIMEGGAYGHMNHPFDTEINLTFGQLKDIVNRALDGNLEFAREKTDGQALAISWIDGRLVAARNKSHLKNKGAGALDINGVADKFAGRGELTDAYNFAMKDLSNAIKSLSQTQKDKVFKNGSCFMNIEVIYPTSVNVIPYGQPLLVFHGTMEYDENGEAIGESAEAGRVLGGMLKQVNADVQSKYTLQGPPVLKLPKSQDLSSKKGKYLAMISKLQKEFGLGDTAGVADYHQAWWENFVDKKSPTTLDNATKMGLVKRWAFNERGFRIDKNSIKDEKTLAWATKIDKEDHKGISKDNLMKFEDIFLGVGADVLEFTVSVLTVNPDSALREMQKRLQQTIKDVQASGNPKKIDKLKLELKRLNAIGGAKRIVPIEGIVFVYNGQTFKLTGAFASLNQLLGIFYA